MTQCYANNDFLLNTMIAMTYLTFWLPSASFVRNSGTSSSSSARQLAWQAGRHIRSYTYFNISNAQMYLNESQFVNDYSVNVVSLI